MRFEKLGLALVGLAAGFAAAGPFAGIGNRILLCPLPSRAGTKEGWREEWAHTCSLRKRDFAGGTARSDSGRYATTRRH